MSLTGEWSHSLWHIHTMECNKKKGELLIQVTTWTNLQGMLLNE